MGIECAVAGGAKLMIQEGVVDDPKPEAIFGLHVSTGMEK